jgi:hypothetical protein
MTRKRPSFEHVQRRDSYAFTSAIRVISVRLSEGPNISRSRVQQDRNEEKINQSTRGLHSIQSLELPLFDQAVDPSDTANIKVLPPSVRGNLVESVWAEISLRSLD